MHSAFWHAQRRRREVSEAKGHRAMVASLIHQADQLHRQAVDAARAGEHEKAADLQTRSDAITAQIEQRYPATAKSIKAEHARLRSTAAE